MVNNGDEEETGESDSDKEQAVNLDVDLEDGHSSNNEKDEDREEEAGKDKEQALRTVADRSSSNSENEEEEADKDEEQDKLEKLANGDSANAEGIEVEREGSRTKLQQAEYKRKRRPGTARRKKRGRSPSDVLSRRTDSEARASALRGGALPEKKNVGGGK